MVASSKPAKKTIFMVRGKPTFSPPGVLGFKALPPGDPDVYEGDSGKGDPNWKCNIHFNPAARAAFTERLQAQCAALWDAMRTELDNAGKAVPDEFRSAPEYLAEKFREVTSEKARNRDPFYTFSKKADFKNRDDQIVRRAIGFWDIRDNPLDPATLNLGMGSVVQVCYEPALFANALIKVPQPSIGLVGLRILKLEQFTGAVRAPKEAISEEDLAMLGGTFEAEDLSGFARGAAAPSPSQPAPGAGYVAPDYDAHGEPEF